MEYKEQLSASIAGHWNCGLDPGDIGLSEQWYKKVIEDNNIKLPGTTNENKLGEPLGMEPVINRESVRCLRQKYRYLGAAWYQKEITIPEEWKDKRVELFLERVMFQSRVWIDGKEIGTRDSLCVPHVYEVSGDIKYGASHILTIRIDNRDVQNIGPNPSAYTDETQTIWNGITGRMELRAFDRVCIRDVQIYPDLSEKKIGIKAVLENYSGSNVRVDLKVSASSKNTDNRHSVEPSTFEFVLSDIQETVMFDYNMGEDVLLWDEFTPALYRLNILLNGSIGEYYYKDEKAYVFGMRELKAEGNHLMFNSRRLFLRGTLDCCIYPLTGYPPTDVMEWTRVFKVVRSYGLNHVRFHSWCPPEAAFTAADNIGVYLQAEGPVWMDTWAGYTVGCHEEHYDYLPAEILRIIHTYGNHPSFCFFSNGNELNGDFNLLHDITEKLKTRDKRHLYTLTTNWDRPIDPADDYFVAQTVDGAGIRGQYYLDAMVEGTNIDYTGVIPFRNVPIVSHEVGAYAIYPSMDEIEKYTGVLDPLNFKAIRNDLEAKGMLELANKFTMGSGMLALQLYRDEIEAAFRTKDFNGFQLLDIHDFPGQSTATVGILDSFWDSKGFIKPEKFRQFCSPTVLLLKMDKRIFRNDEIFNAAAEIAHFGADEMDNAIVRWSIGEEASEILCSGGFEEKKIPIGNCINIGTIENISLSGIASASKLVVALWIENTEIRNTWDIWVYPAKFPFSEEELIAGGNIVISDSIGKKEECYLNEGKNVLITAKSKYLKHAYPGKFFSVFWSPVHFVSEDPCGIYCDNSHPAFREFPTDFYSGYQWKNLLENSKSVCLDNLPKEFMPIVQVVPNFYNNHRMGNLFEARVGKGKLLICSMDIERDIAKRLEARQLRYSILSYMSGEDFMPGQELTVEQVKSLFTDGKLNADSGDRVNVALYKPSASDSEKSGVYSASKGNDGDDGTRWCAADLDAGHWWQVDLVKSHKITGTKVIFEQEANYLYVICVSDDGDNWRLAVNRTGQIRKDRIRMDDFDETARFVRIIYNGLPSGAYASHVEFEVYGEVEEK